MAAIWVKGSVCPLPSTTDARLIGISLGVGASASALFFLWITDAMFGPYVPP